MTHFYASGAVGTTALVILAIVFLFGSQFVGRVSRPSTQKVKARDENLYQSLEFLRASGVQDRIGGVPVPEPGEMIFHYETESS